MKCASIIRSVVSILVIVVLVSCHKAENTIETLAREIDSFRQAPSTETKLAIEKNFAILAEEIAKMENSADTERAARLRIQERDLKTDYEAAKFAQGLKTISDTVRNVGKTIEDSARSIGDTLKKISGGGDDQKEEPTNGN